MKAVAADDLNTVVHKMWDSLQVVKRQTLQERMESKLHGTFASLRSGLAQG